jgi:hypothetical protein
LPAKLKGAKAARMPGFRHASVATLDRVLAFQWRDLLINKYAVVGPCDYGDIRRANALFAFLS